MLGAPMWTRICNLQMETGLPPLTARVKQITVATLAKICRSSKPSTTKVKIRVAYHRDQRTRGTSWLHMAANIIHAYRAETSTLQTEDAPHHRYSLPPPWDPPPATFEVTALGDKKSSLQQEDIRRLSLRAIATETPAGAVAYFTDGSVDQTDERRSGAAFHTQVHTRLEAAKWLLHTTNGANSHLQSPGTRSHLALEARDNTHGLQVISANAGTQPPKGQHQACHLDPRSTPRAAATGKSRHHTLDLQSRGDRGKRDSRRGS